MSGSPDEREVPACLRTPTAVYLLVNYALTNEQHPDRYHGVCREAMTQLEEAGAVEVTDRYSSSPIEEYKITDLGRAWVNALCLVPPPKRVFLDEAGRDVS